MIKRRIPILVISFMAILLQNCKDKKDVLKYDRVTLEYIYSPRKCLFQINFPQKPILRDIERPNNPHNLSEQTATMISEQDSTILSTNFELYSTTYDSANRNKVLEMLKKEAELKGLTYTKVYFDPDNLGKGFVLYGTKEVATDNPGEQVKMVIDEKWYFKNNNLFSLSVTCPFDKYPNQITTKFFASLRLTKL